jgi:aconitate hydratase
MGKNLTTKILNNHLLSGSLEPGVEIGIRIDQTLTQDATGTTAMLLFESLGLDHVKTDLSVSYVDHNMAQFGPENHNDHLYLQSIARKVGVFHSRPGNGICHQAHLERFAKPGATLLGSDSHTPTAGGIGCLAIGAGGLDVAAAMAGGPFYLAAPKVIAIRLTGSLPPWVSAKDIIFKVLSILTTSGNVGCIAEYTGSGIANLSVPQRATITNMGAELGVTTSLFPSDAQTGVFLAAQQRLADYQPLAADSDAEYDRIIDIDLTALVPLTAAPSSPDNIQSVMDLADTRVNQVLIGSCTNSSYRDLMTVRAILKGRTVHPQVELAIAPGSRQVLNMLAANGALADLIQTGARILESACGPCIGLGQSPADGTVSLRTFNRNFKSRSGTKDDYVYLVSPETAAAAALTGVITDPRSLTERLGINYPRVEDPVSFPIDDSMITPHLAADHASAAEIVRAATIVPPPSSPIPPKTLLGPVLIRCGDKITTDHIMPAGAFLKYRSNVPEYAKCVFNNFNHPDRPTFADRALEAKQAGRHGVIVAGDSYGQGSSREHAALCPMYLGVRLVIAKAIERIHRDNLVNFAIAPAVFANPADYDRIDPEDVLEIPDFLESLKAADTLNVHNRTKKFTFSCRLELSPRQRAILAAGGQLNAALVR